jgi:hypothetical protein
VSVSESDFDSSLSEENKSETQTQEIESEIQKSETHIQKSEIQIQKKGQKRLLQNGNLNSLFVSWFTSQGMKFHLSL